MGIDIGASLVWRDFGNFEGRGLLWNVEIF